MAYGNNKLSFSTPSPKSRIFNFITPRHIEEGEFFSRSGNNFQFQDTDSMGLGPYIRLVPSIALGAAIVVMSTLVTTICLYSSELNNTELFCAAILALLVTCMISGCAWLLRDFSESAIIDQKHKTLWLGGGYFGRWKGISFEDIQSVRVNETNKTYTDSHFQVCLRSLDTEYLIYNDSLKHLAVNCAKELAEKINTHYITH